MRYLRIRILQTSSTCQGSDAGGKKVLFHGEESYGLQKRKAGRGYKLLQLLLSAPTPSVLFMTLRAEHGNISSTLRGIRARVADLHRLVLLGQKRRLLHKSAHNPIFKAKPREAEG